jgi:hypothetical protein
MKPLHIILVFCIGLFTGYLLFESDPANSHTVATSAEHALTAMQHTDSVKQQEDSLLAKRNKLISGQLLLANAQLKENKAALSAERQKVKSLQTRLLEDTSSCCDTVLIKQYASQIDTLNAVTDSLVGSYERKLSIADSSIALRNDQLLICNTAYQDMRAIIQDQAVREQQLSDQLNMSLKQQKRRKIQNKVLAAGALILSGITTSLLIRGK